MPFPRKPPLHVQILCLGLATMVLTAVDVELPEEAPTPTRRAHARPQGTEEPMPKSEEACRDDLRELGAAFEAAPAVDAAKGCALPFPVRVSALGRETALRPPAVVACRTARAAARLFQGPAMTAAEQHLDARLSAIRQASGYVCRRINGSSKISQHALGNALDVSAVILAGGRRIAIRRHADAESAEARFQKDVRNAACGIFTTVLGPGTDADHNDHFHFDMKRRRAPYCR